MASETLKNRNITEDSTRTRSPISPSQVCQDHEDDDHTRDHDARTMFYNDNQIIIKGIPNVGVNDIQEYLGDSKASSINICRDSKEAIVHLSDNEDIDRLVSDLNKRRLFAISVTVERHVPGTYICVSHLPHNTTANDVTSFMEIFSPVNKCFIMSSDITGASKDYALVEFDQSHEEIFKLCKAIDGQVLYGNSLQVDVIDHRSLFDNLQSKCLQIDRLPDDYKDVTKLVEVFSCVETPDFCKLIEIQGKSTGAVIGYTTARVADLTVAELKGVIAESGMSVDYGIVGYRPLDLYNSILGLAKPKYEMGSVEGCGVEANVILMEARLVKEILASLPLLLPLFMDALRILSVSFNLADSSQLKPGLLGPRPQTSPLVQPNTQLGLLLVIGLHLYSKQTHRVDDEDTSNENTASVTQQLDSHFMTPLSPMSMLGNPITVQASLVAQNLVKQISEGNDDTTESSNTKNTDTFKSNIRKLNLQSLVFLGQYTIQQSDYFVKYQNLDSLIDRNQSQNEPDKSIDENADKDRPKSLLDVVITSPSLVNKPPPLLDVKPRSLLDLPLPLPSLLTPSPIMSLPSKQLGLLGPPPLLSQDAVKQHILKIMGEESSTSPATVRTPQGKATPLMSLDVDPTALFTRSRSTSLADINHDLFKQSLMKHHHSPLVANDRKGSLMDSYGENMSGINKQPKPLMSLDNWNNNETPGKGGMQGLKSLMDGKQPDGAGDYQSSHIRGSSKDNDDYSDRYNRNKRFNRNQDYNKTDQYNQSNKDFNQNTSVQKHGRSMSKNQDGYKYTDSWSNYDQGSDNSGSYNNPSKHQYGNTQGKDNYTSNRSRQQYTNNNTNQANTTTGSYGYTPGQQYGSNTNIQTYNTTGNQQATYTGSDAKYPNNQQQQSGNKTGTGNYTNSGDKYSQNYQANTYTGANPSTQTNANAQNNNSYQNQSGQQSTTNSANYPTAYNADYWQNYNVASNQSYNNQALYGNNNSQAPHGNNNSQAPYGNNNSQADYGNNNSQAPYGNNNSQAPYGNNNSQAPYGNNNQQSTNNASTVQMYGNSTQSQGQGYNQGQQQAAYSQYTWGQTMTQQYGNVANTQQFGNTQQQQVNNQQQLDNTQQQFCNTQQQVGNTQQQFGNTQQQFGNTQQQVGNTQQQFANTQQQVNNQQQFSNSAQQYTNTAQQYNTNQQLGQSSYNANTGMTTNIDTPSSKTTSGKLKRSHEPIIPHPEPSPQGEYIGQHSQGLGGHYAETQRAKKQRLDNVPLPKTLF